MNDIKFSVIVPVYNRDGSIQRAVDSIVNQTYTNWELIIVNDGSTDGTNDFCEKIVKDNSKIKYFYQENAGVSAARNKGLENADGDYILFLDSDDHYAHNAMEVIYNVITQNDEKPDVIVYGNSWFSPDSDICEKTINKKEINEYVIPAYINIIDASKYTIHPYIHNKCYKKDILGVIKFDCSHKKWEDGLFNSLVLQKINSLFVIKDKLYQMDDVEGVTVNHLSRQYFSETAINYIAEFESACDVFGKTYDMFCDFSCRNYWDVLNSLIDEAYMHNDTRVLDYIVNSKTVEKWISKLTPKDKIEATMFKAIRKHNTNKLCSTIKNSKNPPNKLKKFIKRIIRFIKRHIVKEQKNV